MSKKKIVMMITILFITILSASGFYVLTGETNVVQNIKVENKVKDYEKVYEAGAPYNDNDGLGTYYIRYTGELSGRTIVDLEDVNVKDGQGKNLKGCGLTIGADGYPYIFKQKITSTYKMFSKSQEVNAVNTEITRVFIPSTIAITSDTNKETNKGIASNTFAGWDSETEKDVIYHTGELSTTNRGSGLTATYDRTGKITERNVYTYVYLGSENFSRTKMTTTGSTAGITDVSETMFLSQYAYIGGIKNVYVSKELPFLDGLFSRYYYVSTSWVRANGTIVNKVLIDENGEWETFEAFFCNQPNLELSDKFSILNKKTIIDLECFFWNTNITHLPKMFTIPEGVKDVRGMFAICKYFSDIVVFPSTINYTRDLQIVFENAGTSAGNYKKCNTPIIAKYPVGNTCLDVLTTNVYSPTNTSGKVTMIPLTSDTNKWEKVYEDGAPYYDENGAYYVRYIGNSTMVDLGGTTAYNSSGSLPTDDIVLSASTKHSCVANTKLYSTYKMFEHKGSTDSNHKIDRIYVPSNIAMISDATNKYGIIDNTFLNTTQEIDCIYHTGKLSTTNRGSGLTATYDKTTIFNNSNTTYQTNVIPYVYLGSENFSRTNLDPNNESLYPEWYSYTGKIKNVFVSKEITYIVALFSRYYYINTNRVNQVGSEVNCVLLDGEGKWTNLSYLFINQQNIKLSDKFYIPNIENVTDMWSMFHTCKSLTRFPKSFQIPPNVKCIYSLVCYVPNFSGVITVPKTVNNLTNLFLSSGTQSTEKIEGFNTPIVVYVYKGSYADKNFSGNAYVTKAYVDESGQSLSLEEAGSESVSVENSVENIEITDKIIIEDSTDYVNVTVKKKVDEVVDEIIENTFQDSEENNEE